MIPTAILIGLLLGLGLRTWWSILGVGVIWAAIIAVGVGGDLSVVVGALLLGCINGAAGVTAGRGLRLLADQLVTRPRSRDAV